MFVSAPGSTVSWVVDRVTPGMNDRVACMNASYKKVADAEPNVSFVDFAPYICPTSTECKNTIDGVNLREDTIHYQDESAKLVSRWIIPKVLDAAKQGG